MRRVGVLMLHPEDDPQGQLRATAFRQGFEKLEWGVGRNVQIDFSMGLGRRRLGYDPPPRVLRLAPDVILANLDAMPAAPCPQCHGAQPTTRALANAMFVVIACVEATILYGVRKLV